MSIKKSELAKNEFCLCGCRKSLQGYGRSGYSVGHYPRTNETRKKIAAGKVGKPGHPHTEEHKQWMRVRFSGANNPNFGRRWSKEQRLQIGGKLKALPRTPEWNAKISKSKKGRLPYPHALEILSRYNQAGESHSCWRGGISFHPYPPTFNSKFKRMIRLRDNYTCALCGGYGNSVHHINYMKDDTNPKNCITLCGSCHGKTNHNREYWGEFFVHQMSDVEFTLEIAREL